MKHSGLSKNAVDLNLIVDYHFPIQNPSFFPLQLQLNWEKKQQILDRPKYHIKLVIEPIIFPIYIYNHH